MIDIPSNLDHWIEEVVSRAVAPRIRRILRVTCRFSRQFRSDFGDISADLLDLILASAPFHVADNGLCGEHGRAQQVDFRFGTGPFPALDHFKCGRDHQPARGNSPLLSGFFDPSPVVLVDADVFVDRVSHTVFPRFVL